MHRNTVIHGNKAAILHTEVLFPFVAVFCHLTQNCAAGFACGNFLGGGRLCLICSGFQSQRTGGEQLKHQNQGQKHGKNAERVSLFHCVSLFLYLRIVHSECPYSFLLHL